MPSLARAYGGPVQALIGYVKAGRTAGVRSEVAAPRPPAEDRAWISGELADTTLRLFPAVGNAAFVLAPSLLTWLSRAVPAYDAVHVHGLFNSVSSLSARIALSRSIPVVIRPFGTLSRYTFEYRRRRLKLGFFRLLERPNLTRVDAVHFATAGEAEAAAWHGLDLEQRSWVVPPPLALLPASDRSDPAGCEVLFLSRLHPVKHVELLVDAWPRVLDARPGTRLVLAGDGDPSYVESLRRRIRDRGIEGSVSFVGFVRGRVKEDLIASASLFVLPSYHENFGVAVLEALGAGLPVVVTAEVQLAPFVREHNLGVVVEREPDRLADAMVRVLGDTDLRRWCAEHGPRLVRERFSPEAVGQQLACMYAEVSGRHRHPS